MSLLYDAGQDIKALSQGYEELEGFDYTRLESEKYLSFTHNSSKASMPVFNSGIYWFKVSFSDRAVDLESPMPVLSVEIPVLKKFIKLRVRGTNDDLTQRLAAIVYQRALERGGVDPRFSLQNSRETMGGRSSRRRMPALSG